MLRTLRLSGLSFPDGKILQEQGRWLGAKYDDVVLLTAAAGTPPRAALSLSDLLVIPLMPRSADVWALTDIAALVDQARSIRDVLRACAVLYHADQGSSAGNRDAEAALADFPGLALADAPVRGCKAFANALGMGPFGRRTAAS